MTREEGWAGFGNALAAPGASDLRLLLAGAADAVARATGSDQPAVSSLLEALDYAQPAPEAAGNRAALLRLASRFDRTFRIALPHAPGLCCFGAQAAGPPEGPEQRPAWRLNASGVGLDLRAAFQNCVGEGAEFLSQLERAGDIACTARAGDLPAPTDPDRQDPGWRDAGWQDPDRPNAVLDWVAAIDLGDGSPALLPADRVLRRPPARRVLPADGPQSIGCGAGPDFATACRHALLELVERDAAAQWWRGGRRGHALPPDPGLHAALFGLMRTLRGGGTGRNTWFLDITSDLGIPCVAAVSADPGGRGFACGISARPDLAAAASAALLEACQMELTAPLIGARLRVGGEAALSPADRHAASRLTGLDTMANPLLHPIPHPRSPAAALPPGATLADLVARLRQHGHPVLAADLTRPDIAIPVAVLHVPGLDREPSARIGPRLAAAIAATGGGEAHTGGISLM